MISNPFKSSNKLVRIVTATSILSLSSFTIANVFTGLAMVQYEMKPNRMSRDEYESYLKKESPFYYYGIKVGRQLAYMVDDLEKNK